MIFLTPPPRNCQGYAAITEDFFTTQWFASNVECCCPRAVAQIPFPRNFAFFWKVAEFILHHPTQIVIGFVNLTGSRIQYYWHAV